MKSSYAFLTKTSNLQHKHLNYKLITHFSDVFIQRMDPDSLEMDKESKEIPHANYFNNYFTTPKHICENASNKLYTNNNIFHIYENDLEYKHREKKNLDIRDDEVIYAKPRTLIMTKYNEESDETKSIDVFTDSLEGCEETSTIF